VTDRWIPRVVTALAAPAGPIVNPRPGRPRRRSAGARPVPASHASPPCVQANRTEDRWVGRREGRGNITGRREELW